MAWADNLLDASFRGVRFDCENTSDSADRANAEHSCPYKDGANMEDLGRGPRRFRIDAVFFGDNYDSAMQSFLKALEEGGEGDLVHPVHGALKATVLHYEIQHRAEDVDLGRVLVDFAESTPGAKLFDRTLAVQRASDIESYSGLSRLAGLSLLRTYVSRLKRTLHSTDAVSDTSLDALSGLHALSPRSVFSGLDVITDPESWAADLAGAFGDMLDSYSWSEDSAYSDWKYSRAKIHSPLSGVDDVEETAGVSAVTEYLALERALASADAAQAVLESEADTPTLSPAEVEEVAGGAREDLEAAIETCRDNHGVEESRPVTEGLKNVALAVQTAAQAVIEARPPLVERTLTAPGNLRLIAHRLYGDHGRAPEIYRLNRPRNPNTLTNGDTLHVYAS